MQRLTMLSEGTQPPGEIGTHHDLVVCRSARLQLSETPAHRTDRALRMPEQDLDALDVASDVPRGERVAGALGDAPRALEET